MYCFVESSTIPAYVYVIIVLLAIIVVLLILILIKKRQFGSGACYYFKLKYV